MAARKDLVNNNNKNPEIASLSVFVSDNRSNIKKIGVNISFGTSILDFSFGHISVGVNKARIVFISEGCSFDLNSIKFKNDLSTDRRSIFKIEETIIKSTDSSVDAGADFAASIKDNIKTSFSASPNFNRSNVKSEKNQIKINYDKEIKSAYSEFSGDNKRLYWKIYDINRNLSGSLDDLEWVSVHEFESEPHIRGYIDLMNNDFNIKLIGGVFHDLSLNSKKNRILRSLLIRHIGLSGNLCDSYIRFNISNAEKNLGKIA